MKNSQNGTPSDHTSGPERESSDERHESFWANVPVGVFRTTPDGRFLAVNPTLVEFVGCESEKELLKTPVIDCYANPDQRAEVLRLLAQDGSVTEYEFLLRRKNRSTVWVAISLRAITTQQGETAFDGVCVDISRRKKIEQELQQSEEQFRGLAERSFDAIYMCDPIGNFTYLSPASEKILGYPREEAIGQHFSTFLAEHEIPRVLELFQGTLKGEYRDTLEIEIVRKDGTQAFLEVSHTRLMRGEEPIGVQGLLRNVTESKRVLEALRNSEETYRTLVDACPDAVIVTDLEGRIIYASKRALEMTGYENSNLLEGKYSIDLIAPTEQPKAVEVLQQTLTSGISKNEQFTVYRKDGTHFIGEINAAVIRDTNNKPKAIMGITRNITERKRVEAELATAKKLAEQANTAKSEFLANMSHEIRTPMTAILGYTELLISSTFSPLERRHHLQTIRRNGHLLLEIINNVLDLSRVEAGKLSIDCIECSICQVLEDIRSLMHVRATEKGLTLDIDYQFPLPKTIQTDPVRLQQVLLNLVENAIKFTEKGSIHISVCCLPRHWSDVEIQFTIADTGIGLAADEIHRLFEPFTQADASTSRRAGGTGLGLTISKRLVEMLGGSIQVKSKPGEGTTFVFSIDPGPLDGVEMLNAPPVHKTDIFPKVTAETLMGRILLSDDSIDIQRLVGFLLARTGIRVDFAENGEIACEKAMASEESGTPYDLILMDIQMPKVDGYQATKQLRAQGWQKPIIALTAHAMAGDREKCLSAGCNDYISKPIDHNDLLSTVKRHLEPSLN